MSTNTFLLGGRVFNAFVSDFAIRRNFSPTLEEGNSL